MNRSPSSIHRQGAVAAVFAAMLGACAAPQASEPQRPVTLTSAPIARAPETEKAKAAPQPEEGPSEIPNECATDTTLRRTKVCLPPAKFANKLCASVFSDVALSMFTKGTPWTRVWLAGDVEAWNASGGLTHRAKLAFDEEVILLARHGAGTGGGIIMTGAQASFDVLRWDGSCVSVMEGELTTQRPPTPKPAPITFHRLEETTQRALLASRKVKATHDGVGKACVEGGEPAAKRVCEKAERAFTGAVVDYVRGGGTLPTPARRP